MRPPIIGDPKQYECNSQTNSAQGKQNLSDKMKHA